MSVRAHYEYEGVQGIKVGRLAQGINTQFIVYRMGETVIDSGPSNQWKYVQPFLQKKPVKQLLLTHHHEDHAGNAQRIADEHGVLPKAPKLGQAKMASGYKIPLLQQVVWGKPIPVKTQPLGEVEYLADGSEVIPVHTPGHAKDLTVFYLPKQKYLFSGDLFISRKLKMLRVDENLFQLMDSIRCILDLDFEVVFCPHAGVIEDGKQALKDKYKYLIELCGKVKSMGDEGKNAESIAESILGPESMIARLTGGNFSQINLIKEALNVPLEKFS